MRLDRRIILQPIQNNLNGRDHQLRLKMQYHRLCVRLEEVLKHRVDAQNDRSEWAELLVVLDGNEREDDLAQIDERHVLVVFTDREVDEIGWDAAVVDIDCAVDEVVLLAKLVLVSLVHEEIGESEVVEHEGGDLSKQQEPRHARRVKLASVVLRVEQLLHKLEDLGDHEVVGAEALEALLDDFEVVGVEPLEEEVVLLWLVESFGDAEDAVDDSHVLLVILYQLFIRHVQYSLNSFCYRINIKIKIVKPVIHSPESADDGVESAKMLELLGRIEHIVLEVVVFGEILDEVESFEQYLGVVSFYKKLEKIESLVDDDFWGVRMADVEHEFFYYDLDNAEDVFWL